jgi:hypothetical protein
VPDTGEVIVGVGARLLVTVSVAALLVAVPNSLETTARNWAPLSESCAEESVKLDGRHRAAGRLRGDRRRLAGGEADLQHARGRDRRVARQYE